MEFSAILPIVAVMLWFLLGILVGFFLEHAEGPIALAGLLLAVPIGAFTGLELEDFGRGVKLIAVLLSLLLFFVGVVSGRYLHLLSEEKPMLRLKKKEGG